MLTIYCNQQKVFEQIAVTRFEDEMVDHSRDFSPILCALLCDEKLRGAIRAAILRAQSYGFTKRGPVRLYIEMVLLCGSSFDTDVQYSTLGKFLQASDEQMNCAPKMSLEHNKYLEQVAGSGDSHLRDALTKLLQFIQRPIQCSSEGLNGYLLQEILRIFPQRANYVGEIGMNALIEEGRFDAVKYSFSSVRQITLIVLLMFTFGHGCTTDPFYPWIVCSLQDKQIVVSAERAERLEGKYIAWLNNILGIAAPGVQL